MALKRVAIELGMGTSLRNEDYTKAASRAVSDALWHNSLSMAAAFGFPKEAMIIDVEVATQQPDAIDHDAIASVFPYGKVTVSSVKGGLDIPKPRDENGDPTGKTIMANAVVIVSFDMEKAGSV